LKNITNLITKLNLEGLIDDFPSGDDLTMILQYFKIQIEELIDMGWI
jgi:hypothetical protein